MADARCAAGGLPALIHGAGALPPYYTDPMERTDLPKASGRGETVSSLDEARARRIARAAWRTQLCYGPVAAHLVLMTEDNERAWSLFRELQRGGRPR